MRLTSCGCHMQHETIRELHREVLDSQDFVPQVLSVLGPQSLQQASAVCRLWRSVAALLLRKLSTDLDNEAAANVWSVETRLRALLQKQHAYCTFLKQKLSARAMNHQHDCRQTLISGTLQEEEKRGITRLVALYENGFGGNVLGQRVACMPQVIGLLAHLVEHGLNHHMIVTSKEKMALWQLEFERLAPLLLGVVLDESTKPAERKRVIRDLSARRGRWPAEASGVILTTYSIAAREIAEIKKVLNWTVHFDDGYDVLRGSFYREPARKSASSREDHAYSCRSTRPKLQFTQVQQLWQLTTYRSALAHSAMPYLLGDCRGNGYKDRTIEARGFLMDTMTSGAFSSAQWDATSHTALATALEASHLAKGEPFDSLCFVYRAIGRASFELLSDPVNNLFLLDSETPCTPRPGG